MKKQKTTRLTLLTIVLLLVACSLRAQNPNISENVKISGLVKKSFIITTENVSDFKVYDVNLYKDSSNSSALKNIFKAVLLKDVLDSASVQLPSKKVRGEFVVLATATDGYKVVFAYNELYYGPAALNTWLVFEKNGANLTTDGRFVIHCTSDQVSGSRHVMWLKSIDIKRVE